MTTTMTSSSKALEALPHISIDKADDGRPPPAYTPSSSGGTSPRPLSRASSNSSSPPGYDDATATAVPGLSPDEAAFRATAAFQIQTPGKRWFSLPAAPIPADPIPIYAVSPSAPASVLDSADLVVPTYVSLRRTRGSGNCVLIHGATFPEVSSSSSSFPSSTESIPALATTHYRFGANKPPKMRIFSDGSGPSPTDAFDAMRAARRSGGCCSSSSSSSSSPKLFDEARALDAAGAGEDPSYEMQPTSDHKMSFTSDLCPVSFRSRALRFATPLGDFQWRYSTRPERKAMAAHSLLVLERIVTIADAYPSSSSSASSTLRVPVGFFIRSDDTRSPGTSRSTAGNGGRLLLDLRAWDPKQFSFTDVASTASSADSVVDEKRRLMAADDASAEAMETVERIAITTCLCMLKKEVDRRRLYQALILSGAAGGG